MRTPISDNYSEETIRKKVIEYIKAYNLIVNNKLIENVIINQINIEHISIVTFSYIYTFNNEERPKTGVLTMSQLINNEKLILKYKIKLINL